MANVIKIKNSGVTSNIPATLEYGEIAINYADGKIFYKNSSNSIVQYTTAAGASSENRDTLIRFYMEVF